MSWRAHGTLFLLATIAALALASDLEQPRTASAHSHYFYTLKPIVIGRDNQSTTAIVKSFVVGDTVTLSHSDCPDGVELDYEEAVTAVLAADPANHGLGSLGHHRVSVSRRAARLLQAHRERWHVLPIPRATRDSRLRGEHAEDHEDPDILAQ